ncbi:MAG: hypothetical protein CMI54_01455 [Parcubacteria group bacterium]|nr:hypothetical protein [Parcubacteria group bacterium]|tara:strand:- start:444 stop:797 length:354 start_codon:yes stop_codon:yes gene_type:complete
MSYNFIMPWPPSVNAWKTPFRNRMILTKRGREYRKAALECLEELGLTGEKIDQNLSIHLTLNPPTLRRYDIDNFCKSLFDALTHAEFWIDDEQIHRLVIEKGVKTKGGNVELKINYK